jgi:hypothetical protein
MKNAIEPLNEDTPYEAAIVQEALCAHFKVPGHKSRLVTREKSFLGSGGGQIHYYCFTLENGSAKYRAFGKSAPANEREYRALQYLKGGLPEEERNIAIPITLLRNGNRSLLLLEYLEGYSNPLTIAKSIFLFPRRAQKIMTVGKAILDKMYGLQKHFKASYRPLSLKDTDETPGQPRPVSVFEQLENVKSISTWTKAALRNRINAILKNQTMARRGIVHGQMGMRNVMAARSNIAFIDWEYMQNEGLSLYDPCYAASMLLMRSVQLFVPRLELDMISRSLFQHVERLEEDMTETKHKKFICDSLWFAKCAAMIDTLWQFEATECRRLRALLGQEARRIKYLAYHIEKDAQTGDSPSLLSAT